MTTTTYRVNGMTCGHCVNAVSAELGGVTGVTGVEVDLASGAVSITSVAPVDLAAVRAAVEQAGYELASA